MEVVHPFPLGIAEPEIVLSSLDPLASFVIKSFTSSDQAFWMAATRQVAVPMNNNVSGASFYVDSDGTAIPISFSGTTLVSLNLPSSNTDPDFGKLRIYHQIPGNQTFKTVLLKVSNITVP